MLDDFFMRAIVAGIGIALIAGPLGCFIVWRRMAYFGDTLAHASLLGVALALLFDGNIMLGVFGVSIAISLGIWAFERHANLTTDTLLGLFSHAALAIGLLVLALMTWVRADIMGLLLGDILAVSRVDIAFIYGGAVLIIVTLVFIWGDLFAATVNPELAEAEGVNIKRANLIFMVLMAIVIALAIKVVGALLITALLIIPAAAARRFSSGPEQMALLASAIGVAAVIAGLFGSLQLDTPSGPSIVVAAFSIFLLGLIIPMKNKALRHG